MLDLLWIPAVVVRLVAVVVLVSGPWTDQPAELEGWDAERFHEIAERQFDGWSDVPIEYPPGSVVVFDAIAGDTVVETNRNIVFVSVLAELVTVVLLWSRAGPRSAKAFLVLGLPLVPMGLLRLDLVATALATAAALVLLSPPLRPGSVRRGRWGAPRQASVEKQSVLDVAPATAGARWAIAAFALLVAAGAMVKIWPALVVAGAVAIRRLPAVAAAVVATGAMGLIWLVVVADGVTPVDQVLSLRGATGWHIESAPGALVALLGDGSARLELNAFRIGTLDQRLVTAGRVVALTVIGLLAAAGYRRPPATTGVGLGLPEVEADRTAVDGSRIAPEAERFSLAVLGSVAALLVSAPLLSPQFVLWLTPWGALLICGHQTLSRGRRTLLTLLGSAVTLTGGTLMIFGPSGLAATVPALLLTVRNLALAVIPLLCLSELLKANRQINGTGHDGRQPNAGGRPERSGTGADG